MPVLGITGGIGTGKSAFTRFLHAQLPGEVFDADAVVHKLLAHDETVRLAVREAFGEAIFRPDGTPDRVRLREQIFKSPEQRGLLEAILHPAVRQSWLHEMSRFHSAKAWYLVDIPLLYETQAEAQLSRVVVVACSPATQRERLATQRQLDAAMTEKIIGAQLSLEFKIEKASHVIWNDSTLTCLQGQARLLANWLCKYYG